MDVMSPQKAHKHPEFYVKILSRQSNEAKFTLIYMIALGRH
jgi:hypothetical protein